MTERLYLAVDQGSHATSVFCFDSCGSIHGEAEVEIATTFGDSGQVEHDAAAIAESVHRAVSRILADLGAAGSRVCSIGLATQRSSIVCWDRRSLEPLSPVLSWRDVRAAGYLDDLAVPDAQVRRITGLVKSPHYGASKLRWCIDHLAAVREARDANRLACGPLSSFLVAAITSAHEAVVDPCNASRTLLWDRRAGDWSPVMLEAFGLGRAILPGCVANKGDFGAMKTPVGPIPVTVVTGDQSSVPFVDGIPGTGTAYVNLGTGAFIQKPLRSQAADERLLESVIWRDQERLFCVEGTVNGAAAALDWLARKEKADPEQLVKRLDEWLEHVDAPPIFLNGVGGLGSPYWRPRFESRFLGDGEIAERTVAVAESIVFLLMANLELMSPVASVVVSGGLSRSRGLCQRMADLCGCPVDRLETPQATARGLANRMQVEAAAWLPAERTKLQPRDQPAQQRRWARWREEMASALRRAPSQSPG